MERLDRTEQRIVGVLIEKQLSVPDSYPLSENSLLAGCNQTSNRDPAMELMQFQVAGALMALHEKEWVARVEGGGRVPRYRHRTEERLGVSGDALPVLAELLLRGPQAPGALKPRVARMGFHTSADGVEAVLRELAACKPPLVEQLPLGHRERDQRWRHLIGDGTEGQAAGGGGTTAAPVAATPAAVAPVLRTSAADDDLAARVQRLESQVEELQRLVDELRASDPGT
ncbi:MAG: DUF480 domain-containing protein [Planctomycetes bacterium]|nr:DUF480 domain-containing protein [Planctomycetota bacterium]